MEKSFPQDVEKSVEKNAPFLGKVEKVFLHKGIFPLFTGCGKLLGNPSKRWLLLVEKSAENPGKPLFSKEKTGKYDDKRLSTTTQGRHF
jgi:hypothetical protein